MFYVAAFVSIATGCVASICLLNIYKTILFYVFDLLIVKGRITTTAKKNPKI